MRVGMSLQPSFDPLSSRWKAKADVDQAPPPLEIMPGVWLLQTSSIPLSSRRETKAGMDQGAWLRIEMRTSSLMNRRESNGWSLASKVRAQLKEVLPMLHFFPCESTDREIDRWPSLHPPRQQPDSPPRRLMHLEGLETRITPSTAIWTGWARSNWPPRELSAYAPLAGADLDFPADDQSHRVNDLRRHELQLDHDRCAGLCAVGNTVSLRGASPDVSSGTSTDTIDTQLGGARSRSPRPGSSTSAARSLVGRLSLGGGGRSS